MKKFLLDKIQSATEEPSPEEEKDITFRLLVDRYGPSCAAWLVFKQRQKLRRRGAFDVVVSNSLEHLPTWFLIAIEHLKRRSKWSVEVLSRLQEKRYRIRWCDWADRSLDVPIAGLAS